MSGVPSEFADDYLFGLLALRQGYVTQAQLDEAVAIRIRTQPTPRLIDVLSDLSQIPPAAIDRLTDQHKMLLMGSIAMGMGWLVPTQLREALDVQQRSVPRPLLGNVLVDLGYISRKTLRQLLDKQEEMLSDTLVASPDRKSRRQMTRRLLVQRRKISGMSEADPAPGRRMAVAAVALFGVLLVVAAVWFLGGPSPAARDAVTAADSGARPRAAEAPDAPLREIRLDARPAAATPPPSAASGPVQNAGTPPPPSSQPVVSAAARPAPEPPPGAPVPVIEPVSTPAPARAAAPDPAPSRRGAERALCGKDVLVDHIGKFAVSLACDPSGGVWIGTEDNGLFRCVKEPAGSFRCTQFTTRDGLGDDTVCALAVDRQSRVWAGHARGGVSVFDGRSWKSYGPLDGPLAIRIFDIAIDPRRGDVWIASSAGLSRYSPGRDAWDDFTRADGLPSNQVQCLAVGDDSVVYAGTQCDGLAIGTPAGDTLRWRTSASPEPLPVAQERTSGFPCNLVNDVLVSRDGSVFVATNLGLGILRKGTQAWTHLRGMDAQKKIEGLYDPDGRIAKTTRRLFTPFTAPLAEDHVTALAEDDAGRIWIGYRTRGIELFSPRTLSVERPKGFDPEQFVTRIAFTGPVALAATYGDGLAGAIYSIPARPASAAGVATHPSVAALPDASELARLVSEEKRGADGTPAGSVVYGGDDWDTRGDWIGRYGRKYGMLCATDSPRNHPVAFFGRGYDVKGGIGPHVSGEDSLRHWIHWLQTDNPNTLYNPFVGVRRQAEWDDHGEAYPMTFEGPDLWASVDVPAGTHRVSLYFFNKDGHDGNNRYRDYLIEAKPFAADRSRAGALPTLALARVRDFWTGVYKCFLVRGPGRYSFKVSKNYSVNTILSGVFIDPVVRDGETQGHPYLPGMASVAYDPPAMPDPQWVSPLLDKARSAWAELDKAAEQRLCRSQARSRILLCRVAVRESAPKAWIDRWRWAIPLWTGEDRKEFGEKTREAWSQRQVIVGH